MQWGQLKATTWAVTFSELHLSKLYLIVNKLVNTRLKGLKFKHTKMILETKEHYPDRRMSVLCVSGKRRPQCLLEEAPSLLSSPDCGFFQLPPGCRRCADNYGPKRRGYRGCFIPYGLLLCPTPYVPQVCSHSAFSHTNRGPLGRNPWARPHTILQEGHGRLESFCWPIKPMIRCI